MKIIDALKNWWNSVLLALRFNAEDALHTVGGENYPWHEDNVTLAHINLTARARAAEQALVEEQDEQKQYPHLTLAAAADKLGIAPRTFMSYRSLGKLEIDAVRSGRTMVYPHAQVMEAVAKRSLKVA